MAHHARSGYKGAVKPAKEGDRAMADAADITALLLAWSNGEEGARSRLVEVVYDELRRRRAAAPPAGAPGSFAHADRAGPRGVPEADRSAPRPLAEPRALLRDCGARHAAHPRGPRESARGREARRRGHGCARRRRRSARRPLDVDIARARRGPRQARPRGSTSERLVELRFFAGLTVEETAAALDVAPITVKRDWALARAWLFRELQGQAP